MGSIDDRPVGFPSTESPLTVTDIVMDVARFGFVHWRILALLLLLYTPTLIGGTWVVFTIDPTREAMEAYAGQGIFARLIDLFVAGFISTVAMLATTDLLLGRQVHIPQLLVDCLRYVFAVVSCGLYYGVIVLLGTLLFVFPGIWLASGLLVLPLVMIQEQSDGFFDLFRRSWALTSGARLQIALLLVPIGLVRLGLMAATALAVGLARQSGDPVSFFRWLKWAVALDLFATFAFVVLLSVITASAYVRLRIRAEQAAG